MDPTDYNFDEDEILHRQYIHSILMLYTLTIIVIKIFYICLHMLASFWFENFHYFNPICLLLAMELGLFTAKFFPRRFRRHLANDFFLTTLLMSVVAVSFLLQMFLEPDDVYDFVVKILNSAFGSFIVTIVLCLALIFVSRKISNETSNFHSISSFSASHPSDSTTHFRHHRTKLNWKPFISKLLWRSN